MVSMASIVNNFARVKMVQTAPKQMAHANVQKDGLEKTVIQNAPMVSMESIVNKFALVKMVQTAPKQMAHAHVQKDGQERIVIQNVMRDFMVLIVCWNVFAVKTGFVIGLQENVNVQGNIKESIAMKVNINFFYFIYLPCFICQNSGAVVIVRQLLYLERLSLSLYTVIGQYDELRIYQGVIFVIPRFLLSRLKLLKLQ